ncbi:hypothetical protein ACFS7Z_15640 [Pontibacter toksunensis]|uniref:Polynucleotide kinase-phosphatase ligase domain-containing protein n=2 Tax=Pontibacter toksunensis TaxID=1332631 RepID=A0ABW6BXC0_9BACT
MLACLVPTWLGFVPTYRDRLIQPVLKCCGSDYLRIIYGPEYNLDKTRST